MPNWKKVVVSGSDAALNNIIATGDVNVQGDLIAERYIISSSVSHITQSFSSGSTIFGDTLDDTHQFTGSLLITGNLELEGGSITTPDLNLLGDDSPEIISDSNLILSASNSVIVSASSLQVAGLLYASLSIDNTSINTGVVHYNSSSDELFFTDNRFYWSNINIGQNTPTSTIEADFIGDTLTFTTGSNNIEVYRLGSTGDFIEWDLADNISITTLTASSDISSSGLLIGNSIIGGNITGSNISSSGLLIGNSLNIDNNITGGNITGSNISSSGLLFASTSDASGENYFSVLVDTSSGQFYYTSSATGQDTDWTIDGTPEYIKNTAASNGDTRKVLITSASYIPAGNKQLLNIVGNNTSTTLSDSIADNLEDGLFIQNPNTDVGNIYTHIDFKLGSSNKGRMAFQEQSNAYGDFVFLPYNGQGQNPEILRISTQGITADTSITSSDLKITDFPSVSASLASLTAGGGDNLGNHIAEQDLDMAGFSISASLNITASGNISASGALISNELTASGLNYPNTDGEDGQVILTDGSGKLTFGDVKVYAQVKNISGVTLVKGTPVHATASLSPPLGNVSEVIAASASLASSMPATFVLDEDLADEAEGRAILSGFINDVDTSAFNEGDIVYVGPDGGYTTTKPTGTNLIQNLGIITKVDNTNGAGYIYGSGRSNDVPNIAEGYAWVGNSSGVATATATSSFISPGTISGSIQISDLGFVDTTGTPANNQIAIFTDADTIEGTSELTYDGTTLNLDGNLDIDHAVSTGAVVDINNTFSNIMGSDHYALKVTGGQASGAPGGYVKAYGGYFTAGNTNATNPDSIALYAQGHEDGAPNSYAAIFSGSAGGVVGINTMEPGTELEVVGTISASGGISASEYSLNNTSILSNAGNIYYIGAQNNTSRIVGSNIRLDAPTSASIISASSYLQGTHLYVDDYIERNGDPDTSIKFNNNQILINVGSSNSQAQFGTLENKIGNASAPLDLKINSNKVLIESGITELSSIDYTVLINNSTGQLYKTSSAAIVPNTASYALTSSHALYSSHSFTLSGSTNFLVNSDSTYLIDGTGGITVETTEGSFNNFRTTISINTSSLDTQINNLNSVTGSYAVTASNTFTDSQTIQGNITASGNISASGTIEANGFIAGYSGGGVTNGVGINTNTPSYNLDVVGNVGINDFIYHNGDNDTYLKFDDDQIDLSAGGEVASFNTTGFTAPGHITASGNISASGNLLANVTDSSNTGYKTVVYDTATGQFYRTGSYGGGGGSDNLGNHTATQDLDMAGFSISASLNITASGAISASSIHGTLQTAAQPNITSLGTLTSLTVDQLNLDSNTLSSTSDSEVFITLGVNGISFEANNGDKFIFNGDQENIDLDYTGTNDLNLFYIDASEDKVGIGTSTPGEKLEVVGNISASGIISASNIHGNNLTISNEVYVGQFVEFTEAPGGTNFRIDYDSSGLAINEDSENNPNTVFSDNSVKFYPSITASSDISASGLLFAGLSEDTAGSYNNTVVYDTTTGQLYYTGSYGSGGGGGGISTIAVGVGLDVTNATGPTTTIDLNLTEVIAGDSADRVLTTDADGTLTAEDGITSPDGKTFEFNVGDAAQGAFGLYTDLANDIEPGSSADIFIGDIVNLGPTSTLTAGNVYNLSGSWGAADANDEEKSSYLLGIAVAGGAGQNKFMLRGYCSMPSTYFSNTTGVVAGSPIYVDSSTSGTAGKYNFKPPGTGETSRIVGHLVETYPADGGRGTMYKIYFNPSPEWIVL